MPHGYTSAGVRTSARAALRSALQNAPGIESILRAGHAPEDVADTLLQCVSGEVLDFQKLDHDHAGLVSQMPPDAWHALQAHAAAGGGAGISTLILPAPDADNAMPRRFALRGWIGLPALSHLQLARTTRTDASAATAPAAAAPSPPPRKPSADAARWDVHSSPASNWDAPFRASDLNSLPPRARMLESRHLAMHWMDRRVSHGRSAAAAPGHSPAGEPAAAAPSATPAVIDFKSLTWAGPQALFEISQFGNMIAQEMEGMAIGEARHFALLSPSHTYALELETRMRSIGACEYIVNFYDPEAMATHERVVVDAAARLRHRPLNAWITESALRASFGIGTPRIGCLYRWHPQAAAPQRGMNASLDIHVADEHRSSPAFLYWALMAGHADSVSASIRRTLALANALEPDILLQRLAARPMHTAGLFSAMGDGRVNAVARYADAILKTPPNILNPAQRHVLLKADRRGLHAVGNAMMEGQAATVACYTRAIVEAPEGSLTHEHKMDLLLAACPHGSASSPAPALHKVCTRNLLVVPDSDMLHKQHQAIYRHLREIVASDRLSERDKGRLCAAVHRKNFYTWVTAAQAAMKAGNAGAAAAMVVAVLEGSEKRKSAAALLRFLGVPLEQVLHALARSSPQGLPWGPRIMASLHLSGLPSSKVEKLLRDYGPVTGMQRIGDRWRVAVASPGMRRTPGTSAPGGGTEGTHGSQGTGSTDNSYDTQMLPLLPASARQNL